MSNSIKTIAFLVFGFGLAGTAYFVDRAAQPAPSDADALIGQPFFEEFESALDAASLRVSAVDAESAELNSFRVENKDGLWRIPSRYDYPAEAVERLSNTATSVMGIIRETEAGAEKSRHPRFGVVDPESFDPSDEESYDLEGYGKRITLYDEKDEVLADFIIGKEVQIAEDDEIKLLEEEGEKLYYIRRADENRTYAAKLNIDLSTRFEDWIKPDLLEVDPNTLTRINIDKYELQESQSRIPGQIQPMRKVQLDEFAIVRPDAAGTWALEDFDQDKETLVNSRLDEIVAVIGNLKIADVRPKTNFKGQPLVTADLEVNQIPELLEDPATFQRLMTEMQQQMESNGFTFANEDGKLNLVSKFGEVAAGTEDGISYRLLFGDEFTAESKEIDVQGTKPETEDVEPESEASDSEDNKGENRYMMVHVQFDETLLPEIEPLGDPPAQPSKPEGYQPKKEPEKTDDDKAAEENRAEQKQESDEEPAQDERDPKFIEYDQAMAEYERKLTDYELKKTRFEEKTKARAEEIKQGRKRAAELNERFGLWFYVIKAENINSLLSSRDDIVQPKAQENPPENQPARPDISFPPIPGLESSTTAEEKDKSEPGSPTKKQPSPPQENLEQQEKSTIPNQDESETDKPGTDKPTVDKPKEEGAKTGPVQEETAKGDSVKEKPAEGKEKSSNDKPKTDGSTKDGTAKD